MASSMIVIKTAAYGGGTTSAMNQMTAQTYLGNLLQKGSSRVTNLSQALNQAFNGQGKSCGNLMYEGHTTLHASAGKEGVSSVTLFYYELGMTLYCFAMGEHVNSSSYKLSDFGPAAGNFQYNKTVQL
jgi:L-asparaginase II